MEKVASLLDFGVVPGLNTNIVAGGQTLHVQTEDLGRSRAAIVTHVFSSGGQVVRVVRFDYAKHIEHPGLHSILPRALQTQHHAVTRKLLEEAGDLPGDQLSDVTPPPCLVADTAPVSTEYARADLECRRETVEPGLWDRLVARAKNEAALRRTSSSPAVATTTVPAEPQGGSSGGWDAAVDRIRKESCALEHAAARAATDTRETPELAARAAYEEGRERQAGNDLEGALVAWATAVKLQPRNRRYRASLLDLLLRLSH